MDGELPADARARLGALYRAGDMDGVVALGEALAADHPRSARLFNIVGSAHIVRGDLAAAQETLERVLEIDPAFPEAAFNLALALEKRGYVPAAIEAYAREIALQPRHAAARAQKLHQQARICDWSGQAEFAGVAAWLGIEGAAVPPFTMLALEDDPARHRLRSEAWVAQRLPAHPAPHWPAPDGGRIRIGYFSSDFHDHATMYLMAGLFPAHDRTRFAIHVYSYGDERAGRMRDHVRAHVDRFVDVAGIDEDSVVGMARADRLDIAVDLKGYTGGARPGLFARRLAPLQLAWLGYPGTSGAPFIDYIVADARVIPPAERAHYREHVIALPDSYQVNDRARAISDRPTTRADHGLPPGAFVFAALNENYKIRPAEWDIWMRLLRAVPHAVLWLLESNGIARGNLQREAAGRGIDPARLVFAPWAEQAEHLARQRHADLFLDTFHVNAHTTASDALWAGLPLLTRAGRGFAARVATSLLHAVGLPELVTHSDAEYEALALALARDPARLAALRAKLAANRLSAPLFDTARFARHLERGFAEAHARRMAGLPPADIAVPALPVPPPPPKRPAPAGFSISIRTRG